MSNQAIPVDPTSGPTDRPLGAGLDFSDPNSALARYYLGWADVMAGFVLASLFALATYLPLWHTDVWGHLKFGEWIVTQGELPDQKLLSPFADPDISSRNTYWLIQAGLYQTYRAGAWFAGGESLSREAGGIQALTLLHAMLLTLRFGLLYLAFRRVSGSAGLALFGLVMTMVLQVGHLAVLRPQVIGEVFFAAGLLMISRRPLSWFAVGAFPVMLALWANCHGSYLVGFALLGGCAIGRVIELFPRPLTLLTDTQLRRVTLAGLGGLALISVATPTGIATFTHTLEMARNPNVATMDEWQPIFADPDVPAAFFGITLALLVGAALWSRRMYPPTSLVLLLLFGALPIMSQRSLIWWLALVPWLMLPLVASTRKESVRVSEEEAESEPRTDRSFRKTLLAVAVGVLGVWLSAPAEWIRRGEPRPVSEVVSPGTPWELANQLRGQVDPSDPPLPMLADVLREAYPEGRLRGRVFASETQGDYVLWSLPAENEVIMYSHVHLFPQSHWDGIRGIKLGRAGWDKALDRMQVNLIVIEAEGHPDLSDRIREHDEWHVVRDEAGDASKGNSRFRLLIAIRKKPLA